jgi:hypothetical protein
VLVPRSKEAILGMFNGRDLVDPGLVLVSYWRPEGGDPGPDADKAWVYGGVAAVELRRMYGLELDRRALVCQRRAAQWLLAGGCRPSCGSG